MEDIVDRLRVLNFKGPWQEAADKIEQVREALQDLLNATEGWVFHESYPLAVDKAKAALKEGE
jgi:hypothetical protein